MLKDFKHLEKAETYSNDIVSKLREELDSFSSKDTALVTVGSFARREASNQSDLDFFVVSNGNNVTYSDLSERIIKLLIELDIKPPSGGGAFGGHVNSSEMLINVGGNEDGTEELTRRLLFLMESDWLVGKEFYTNVFHQLIDKYVNDKITQHQLCRFLLNDLIRYYRTICVDFEYKTTEANKSWGDRNIKLMFSRKLMFFSGILVVAETVQNHYLDKRNILVDYLKMPPIMRIKEICGSRCENTLKLYAEFIDALSDPKIRHILNNTTNNRKEHCQLFRKYKNKGHHFSWELARLLNDTYDSSHPIHLALKF